MDHACNLRMLSHSGVGWDGHRIGIRMGVPMREWKGKVKMEEDDGERDEKEGNTIARGE